MGEMKGEKQMIGYKAAYNGKIEYDIDLKDVAVGEIAIPEGKFDKELRRGFSLYKDFKSLIENYYIKGMMFFKVESVGLWEDLDEHVVIAEGFENIKEIKREELEEFIRANQEELFTSPNPLIRKAVVAAGYKIEEALHDEAATVRAEVANQGKYLDLLENDGALPVLYAVVKQNHNLEKFLNHEDFDIRTEAKKRYKVLKTKEE